jgi:hypothetical protein
MLKEDTKLALLVSKVLFSTISHSLVLHKTESINVFIIDNSKYMPYGITVAGWLHITSLALALSKLINKGVMLP